MKKIAILASGSGTNAENIYKFFSNGNRVRVPLVIYDRTNAGVAERMAKYPDVATLYFPKSVWTEHPEEILDILRNEEIDLVVLAGFLRFVPKELTEAFAGRMLNIHPSLIPAHCGPGMYGDKVHQAVIAAGDRKSGVTVHYVSDIMDGGEILMQEEVDVAEGETPESLAQKIHAVEYSLYPRAIVAALSRLETEAQQSAMEMNPAENISDARTETPPTIKGVTPPPTPTPAEEWADTLGVAFDPDKVDQAMHRDNPANPDPASDMANPGMPTAGYPRNFNQGFNAAAPNPGNNEKMPPTYLVWSVVMTVICCLPAGIAAIIFSCQVSSKFFAGDYAGAVKASQRAEIWIIVSFVLGVLANTLYLPISLLF